VSGQQDSSERRHILWNKVALGGFIGSLAAGATAIDIANNHAYGTSISPTMAAVMTLAALGLTAIPGVAAIRGWSALRLTGAAICFVTTAYCAVNAYAARQSVQILAAETASTAYADARQAIEDARREAKAARADAEAIAEKLPSAELQRLFDAANQRVQDESTDIKRGAKCGDLCRQAERERDGYSPRIAQAKARDAALARAESAEARLANATDDAKAGDAEPNMIASAIAGRYGLDAHETARTIALIMAGLGIAVTLIMACYMHDAVSLIAEGWRGELVPVQAFPAADVRKPQAIETEPIAVLPLGETERLPLLQKALEPRAQVELFVRDRIREMRGSEVTAGQLYDAFLSWSAQHLQGVPVLNSTAFGLAARSAGLQKARRGGRTRYQDIQLNGRTVH
jgi:hypothetical protein